MTDTSIEAWIADLAAANAQIRGRAARSLYDRGCALAQAATAGWREHRDLAPLFAGAPTVGLAVRPETFMRIHAANGSPPLASVPPDQDAREFELRFLGGISLDILTTGQPGASGAIARFLERRGEAIQQVELPVRNVDLATALLRERFGLEPIYPATRPGADATRVNFFLLALVPGPACREDGNKILIELVEGTPAPARFRRPAEG